MTPEKRAIRSAGGRATVGAANGQWKGESAGYAAKHHWVRKHAVRTGTCSECGGTPEPGRGGRASTEWANVSGEYLRDLDDYLELCVPCHKAYDRVAA